MVLSATSRPIQGLNDNRAIARAAARPRWMHRRVNVVTLKLIVTILALLLRPSMSEALPSFASQTGLPCTSCHVVGFGPALTAFGRQFKLNGYTLGGGSS